MISPEFEKGDCSVPIRFGNDVGYAKRIAASKAFGDLNDDVSRHLANMNRAVACCQPEAALPYSDWSTTAKMRQLVIDHHVVRRWMQLFYRLQHVLLADVDQHPAVDRIPKARLLDLGR